MKKVHFSIITVCYNSEKTIEQTLLSVINQTYNNFDFFVIDGASTDSTLRIILEIKNKYPAKIDFISEPDNGIYDAMNKGLKMIYDPKSYVLFLNADDCLYNSEVLQIIANNANDADFLYGNVELLFGNNRKKFGCAINKRDLFKRTICHQAVFSKRNLFDRIGLFDTSFKIISDHDLIFKVFSLPDIKILYLPEIISSVRTDGFAKSNAILGRKEYLSLIKKRAQNEHIGFYFWVHFILVPRVWILNITYFLKLENLRLKFKK